MKVRMYSEKISVRIDKAIGYCYFIDKDHPLASGTGRVYYHRHIASLKLGRWLKSGEKVHHIDGNPANNNPNNLVVVTQRQHSKLHGRVIEPRKCPCCGVIFKPSQNTVTHCSLSCSQILRHNVRWPTKEKLAELVWQESTEKIAKRLGVSGVAIGKRCKCLGIKKPGRGYWAKQRAGFS